MALSPNSATVPGRRGALTTMYRQDAAKNEVPTSSSIARTAASGNPRLTQQAVQSAAARPPASPTPAPAAAKPAGSGFLGGMMASRKPPASPTPPAPTPPGIYAGNDPTSVAPVSGMGAAIQQRIPNDPRYNDPRYTSSLPAPAPQPQANPSGQNQIGGGLPGLMNPQPSDERNYAQREMMSRGLPQMRGYQQPGKGMPQQAPMRQPAPAQQFDPYSRSAPAPQWYGQSGTQGGVYDRPEMQQQAYNPWAGQTGRPSELWAQQQGGDPSRGRSMDIDYGAPRNMPQMQAQREQRYGAQQDQQAARRSNIPMFAYGTGQNAYNQAGMGGSWIPSSQNTYAQGKQIPPMMQRLIDQGMPIPPALLNSVTGGQNGPLNMAAAFTARGGGSMPSMQGYNGMSMDEREAFGGYLTGPIGMPEASTMESISRPTQNLQRAPVSRI